MNEDSPPQGKPAWTWADQISTYRFWGLLLFYYWSAISLGIWTTFQALFSRQTIQATATQTGLLTSVLAIGAVFGFYLAWAGLRGQAKTLLIVAGIMQLFGGLLVTIPGLATVLGLRLVGAFLLGLATGTILLAVPSILAGGRGGSEALAIAFGVMLLSTRIGQLTTPTSVGALANMFGPIALTTTVALYVVLGLIFLLPVKSSLFQDAPGPRGYSLAPAHRGPWVVALLCFIPLFGLFWAFYWLYRAHGEVASLAPSRSILSPRASVVACLFLPAIYPVALTSLVDALNSAAVTAGRLPYRRPWVLAVLALFFYPAAMGLLQSSMNRATGNARAEA